MQLGSLSLSLAVEDLEPSRQPCEKLDVSRVRADRCARREAVPAFGELA